MDRKRGTSMIELGKTYPDKSGNSVRIICVDKLGDDPIIGLFTDLGTECVRTYQPNGSYCSMAHQFDLILPEDYSTYVDGEPVMVRNMHDEKWGKRNFACVNGGWPCTWTNGTKWHSYGGLVEWSQCRRPTAEELGEK